MPYPVQPASASEDQERQRKRLQRLLMLRDSYRRQTSGVNKGNGNERDLRSKHSGDGAAEELTDYGTTRSTTPPAKRRERTMPVASATDQRLQDDPPQAAEAEITRCAAVAEITG
jgi:hypothetical protein